MWIERRLSRWQTLGRERFRVYERGAAIRANSLPGGAGYSVIVTSKEESASSTAATIAPAAGTQPDSPTPLTPRGLSREGHSRKWTSIVGTSVAVGSR